MENTELHTVLMTEDDYCAIKPLAGMARRDNVLMPVREPDNAIILRKNAFPRHAIRLQSLVSLVEKKTNKSITITFTILLKKDADMNAKKISALTPMAVAIVGLRQGEGVSCELPGGARHFVTIAVINQPAP